jgi:cell division protein FtsN
MNRQRLLWVILSVTLLVILILVGGLWLFRDKSIVPVAEGVQEPRVNYDFFDITSHNTPLPGIQELEQPRADREQDGIEKQDFVIGENLPETDNVLSEKAISRKPVVRATPAPRREVKQKQTTTSVAKRIIPAKRSSGHGYWIQTGSFKSKSKADECNAVLIENGLAGRILTKEVNKNTYFRVRIGPYENKKEADKFLSWIRKIAGMEESYISID